MPRRRSGEPVTSPGRSPKRPKRGEVLPESRAGRDRALGNDISGRIRSIPDKDLLARNAVIKEIKGDSELRPRNLQLYPHENKHAHHTEEYETEELVLRRGQDFDMAISFDRPFDKETDTLILQFVTGARPKESKGSVIRIEVGEGYEAVKDNWQARIVSSEENTVEIRLISSPDAIIGKYKIFIETLVIDGDNAHQNRKGFEETFVLIFNPFCSGDLVYIEDADKRTEYVMNETGRIWQGSSRGFFGKPWNFGQFEAVCLEAALYLLEKSELSVWARSNVVEVVRTISQMSNSNDEDGGVLEGRWTETYPKGTTLPWAWSGSVAILTEFMNTKKTVKFGQCWVFSGLVTTLCRALGIPTRSVTNFESAHDTDSSMTIDYHWNEANEPLEDDNDSVWNFHVWNESWFRRPDLPEGYDGWQAHDSTPQEASEGVMKCGPSPVKAIKDGNVYLPYDTKFIFAEVNGDKIHWLVKEDGSSEVLGIEDCKVGKNISTKAVGKDAREDVTLDYKYKEGSSEERTSVHRAFRYSSRKEFQVYKIKEPDVKFDLISPEHVTIGDDFELQINLKNLVEEERNIKARISVVASFYTGVSSCNVVTKEFEETLAGKEEKTVSLPVTNKEYVNILKPDSILTIYMKGSVNETGRSSAHIDNVSVVKPDLLVSVPEKVHLNEEFEVVLHMTNPLKEKITGAVFYLESSRGFRVPFTVPYKKAIGPGESISVTLNASCARSGSKDIIANFTADKITGMTGTASIYVSYAE